LKIWKLLWLSMLVLLSLPGCRTPASPPSSTPQTSPLASPLPVSDSPVMTPLPIAEPALVEFQLDGPLLAGDTQVSGTGVAGVPIIIMDVSRITEIGSGVVGQDNRFSITTSEPLVAYSIIGVMVDQARPSPYTVEQLPCGETCRDQPHVGVLLARAPVRKP
jgi:hypothetical protein